MGFTLSKKNYPSFVPVQERGVSCCFRLYIRNYQGIKQKPQFKICIFHQKALFLLYN